MKRGHVVVLHNHVKLESRAMPPLPRRWLQSCRIGSTVLVAVPDVKPESIDKRRNYQIYT